VGAGQSKKKWPRRKGETPSNCVRGGTGDQPRGGQWPGNAYLQAKKREIQQIGRQFVAKAKDSGPAHRHTIDE